MGYYNNVAPYSIGFPPYSAFNSSNHYKEIICNMRDSLTQWFDSTLPLCQTVDNVPPCKTRAWYVLHIGWYSQESTELEVGTTVYRMPSLNLLPNQVFIYRTNTTDNSGSVKYTQEMLAQWEDVALFDDDWYFVKLDGQSKVQEIIKINTIENPDVQLCNETI